MESLARHPRSGFTSIHGCGGKPAGWNERSAEAKPRVNDSLSQFAADLRHFIGCQDSGPSGVATSEPVHGEDEGDFEVLARRLFILQQEANPSYRAQVSGCGITRDSLRDWRSIPALPTAAFKELELTCLPANQRSRVFFSSGTTGQTPSRHFHGPESLALYEASLWPWFRRHVLPEWSGQNGAGEALQMVSLTPTASEVPHSSLAHMLETVMRKVGAANSIEVGAVDADGVWHVSVARLLVVFGEAIAQERPVLLMGTAFNFVHVLDYLEMNGQRLELPPGSRVMETGGYKGRSRVLSRAELHAGVTERLGIPLDWIVSEYGMSELSSQAYDTVAGQGGVRCFRFPPWVRARVISVENGREVADGATGLLRIVDLANAWSVMAVQTEDLAVRRAGGFELLGRAPSSEARGCSLRSFGGD